MLTYPLPPFLPPPSLAQIARLGAAQVQRQPQDVLFCNNGVKNSKYTVISFLPKSIFEQFRRLANVDFLAMGFLMLLGTYTTIFQTPLTAFSTLFPLTIVLGISMIQEAATDIKRHRSDNETNRLGQGHLLAVGYGCDKRNGVLARHPRGNLQ